MRAPADGSLTLVALPPPFNCRQTGPRRKPVVTTCHFELLPSLSGNGTPQEEKKTRGTQSGRFGQKQKESYDKGNRKKDKDDERSTVVVGWSEGRTVASHPRVNRHEFRDEAGYGALHDGCVSAYYVFGHNLRFVVLSHD